MNFGKIQLVVVCLFFSGVTYSQKFRNVAFTAGVGTFSPFKPDQSTYSTSGAFEIGTMIPWHKKISRGNISFTGKVTLMYAAPVFDRNPSQPTYKYNTGTEIRTTKLVQTLIEKSRFIQLGLGEQVSLTSGKFFAKASMQVGYSLLKLNGWSYSDSVYNSADPSLNTRLDFISFRGRNIGGVIVNPRLGAGFQLGSNLFFDLSVGYNFISSPQYIESVYQPAGTPTSGGVYTFQNMTSGKYFDYTRNSRLNSLSYIFQLSYQLPVRNKYSARNLEEYSIQPPRQSIEFRFGDVSWYHEARYLRQKNDLAYISKDTSVLKLTPNFINVEFKHSKALRLFENDSVALTYQLYQMQNGRTIALPIPIFYKSPTFTSVPCGSENCQGNNGNCTSADGGTFCTAVSLSADLEIPEGRPTGKNVSSSKNVSAEFIQVIYYAYVNGSPVKITIESRLNKEGCQHCWLISN